MNKTVLIIDIETIQREIGASVNSETDRVMEIAAVKYDWTSGQQLQSLSQLIDEKDRLPISKRTRDLTSLTDEIIGLGGIREEEEIIVFLRLFLKMIWNSDYLLSPSAMSYTIPVLSNMMERYDFKIIEIMRLFEKTWIDPFTNAKSKADNCHGKTNLSFVMSYRELTSHFPQRALTNCLALFKLISHYSLDEMIESARNHDV